MHGITSRSWQYQNLCIFLPFHIHLSQVMAWPSFGCWEEGRTNDSLGAFMSWPLCPPLGVVHVCKYIGKHDLRTFCGLILSIIIDNAQGITTSTLFQYLCLWWLSLITCPNRTRRYLHALRTCRNLRIARSENLAQPIWPMHCFWPFAHVTWICIFPVTFSVHFRNPFPFC